MNHETTFVIPKTAIDELFDALDAARNPTIRAYATDAPGQLQQRVETERLNQLDRLAAILRKHTQ